MKNVVINIVNRMSIAQIFHGLWHIAIQWPTEEQTLAIQDNCRERLISTLLDTDDEREACRALLTYVTEKMDDTEHDTARGIVLDIMYAIDKAFSRIHPRQQSAASVIRPKPVNVWLKDYRARRRDDGSYLDTERDRLITRGPLAKKARSKDASYAANLEDCFSSICVVPIFFECKGRPVRTDVRVVSKSGINGVSNDFGRQEQISVMPLAEQSEDLSITCIKRNNGHFAKYEASHPRTVADRLIHLLSAEKDEAPLIAIAPELLVDAKTADDIEEEYGQVAHPPRLLVCGSGHTTENKGGQAWNESRAINAAGIELWRQRKIWPASIDSTWAKNYDLSDPSPGHLHEDNCSSDKLIIADLDDLGRCVIMICQDFEATSLAEVVIRCYQPDWVFVPILDRSVDVGRWGHSRAFNLSNLSQARFIIVSSTALYDRYRNHADPKPKARRSLPFALMVSPKISESGDSRAYKSIALTKTQALRAIKVAWAPNDQGWKKTTLS